jgi:hypothetical protein
VSTAACSGTEKGKDAVECVAANADEDADALIETCEHIEFSIDFGFFATDLSTAFLTFGALITLTFTLLLFSLTFARKLAISSSEILQFLQDFLYL